MSEKGRTLRLAVAGLAICTVFGLLAIIDSATKGTSVQTTDEATSRSVEADQDRTLQVLATMR